MSHKLWLISYESSVSENVIGCYPGLNFLQKWTTESVGLIRHTNPSQINNSSIQILIFLVWFKSRAFKPCHHFWKKFRISKWGWELFLRHVFIENWLTPTAWTDLPEVWHQLIMFFMKESIWRVKIRDSNAEYQKFYWKKATFGLIMKILTVWLIFFHFITCSAYT